MKRILDIWEDGYGVISIHVFQNSLPVEAFCREAAMIEAIGIKFKLLQYCVKLRITNFNFARSEYHYEC